MALGLLSGRMTRTGLGLMLCGIRGQFRILVILLVFSTGLTFRLACTHRCTYTHAGKPDNKPEMITCYQEKGGAIYNMMR